MVVLIYVSPSPYSGLSLNGCLNLHLSLSLLLVFSSMVFLIYISPSPYFYFLVYSPMVVLRLSLSLLLVYSSMVVLIYVSPSPYPVVEFPSY
jgi:hypothetical protein